MSIHGSGFEKRCTTFLSARKFAMVAFIGVNRNRGIATEGWLISEMAIGVGTNSKNY